MNGSLLLTLVLDCVLGILLISTMIYCSKLSRRIQVLRDSRGEFARMIEQFDTATGRAMASVNDLQTVSKKITDALQLKIEKANFLADDLAFLIEKSNKLVLQLEQARVTHKNQEPRPVARPSSPPPAINPKQAVDAVLHALTSGSSSSEQPSQNKAIPNNITSLSAPSGEKVVPRTGAERELLTALKLSR